MGIESGIFYTLRAVFGDNFQIQIRLDCVYGPFKYDGQYTSESNARFQEWLKAQDSVSGIRDFEKVNALAESAGMTLLADHPMPANNQLLVWKKTA